jgi:glucose/arabinose dehydrogenase
VGVDVYQGDLYFSGINEIFRLDNIEDNLDEPGNPVLVSDDFPSDLHHGWKFIRFGPDGKLYVPVGAPCNICDEGDPYAAIHRMNPDGSGLELIVRGMRNSVGFDWQPGTDELWFTDNGGDNLGDDIPPCELNRVPADFVGIPHYGYPYFHAMSYPDPEFSEGHNAEDYIEPVQPLGPHVAPLGMRFYTGSMFPAEYQGDVFIAEHGSWNRSTPIGYRVTRVRIGENGESLGYEDFATGWQDPENLFDQWGRPVDVLVMPDGSLLVSDDSAGAIYRIAYGE